MEYKKNEKKLSLTFKKEIALKAVSNERKLEESKPTDVWNAKKRKWAKPSSQIGCKTLTVREIFVDMKDEIGTSSDYKSCINFVGRCEELLTAGQFDIERNDLSNKFRVAGAGTPKKAIDLRNDLFQYYIDIRSSLKAKLPKNILLAKARSLYTEYCKLQREQG